MLEADLSCLAANLHQATSSAAVLSSDKGEVDGSKGIQQVCQ